VFTSISRYLGILAGAAILGLSLALLVRTHQFHAVEKEYETFQITTKVLGEQAEKKRIDTEAKDLLRKKQADEEIKTLMANLATSNRRMRDARASSGYLPKASPTTERPDRITLDRAELERAIGQLDKGLQGITEQGDSFRLKLDTAIKWAQPN
jgi:hypothetical protein